MVASQSNSCIGYQIATVFLSLHMSAGHLMCDGALVTMTDMTAEGETEIVVILIMPPEHHQNLNFRYAWLILTNAWTLSASHMMC